ncbi:hypothetical protein TNCV_3175641 [Trichonephila clavipes]|nr:hypothetical protein TNCV_3175641 [Trichonephila clavipes]
MKINTVDSQHLSPDMGLRAASTHMPSNSTVGTETDFVEELKPVKSILDESPLVDVVWKFEEGNVRSTGFSNSNYCSNTPHSPRSMRTKGFLAHEMEEMEASSSYSYNCHLPDDTGCHHAGCQSREWNERLPQRPDVHAVAIRLANHLLIHSLP